VLEVENPAAPGMFWITLADLNALESVPPLIASMSADKGPAPSWFTFMSKSKQGVSKVAP
jgi:hypothetical protein